MTSIYLDHAATTPIHPHVLERMLPYYKEQYGNPSSIHTWGRTANRALNEARARIADCLGAQHGQIVFTSGGTESDNMALFGVMSAQPSNKRHLITSQIEHHAVLDTCQHLERLGFTVTYVPSDRNGIISPERVEAAIREDTAMISTMYVNNEVGTIQPIEQIGTLAKSHNLYFHVDAVQALGHIEFDLAHSPIDLMSVSAHKINGPKGIGALYVAPNVQMLPYQFGGSQERKRRGGTENVAGAVGFAEAVMLASQNIPQVQQKMHQLRQIMIDCFGERLGRDGFVVNGHPTEHVSHLLNVSFPGTETSTLLMNLDLHGIACSSGSACTSGSLETSHVLHAMQLPKEITSSAIRYSFGFDTTADETRTAARITAEIVNRLRRE